MMIMKRNTRYSSYTIASLLMTQCCVVVNAFTTSSTQYSNIIVRSNPKGRSILSLSLSSSSNVEVEALLAAAAKAREEANRLSKELGKPITTTTSSTTSTSTTTQTTTKSIEEIQSMIPTILSESDLQKQVELLQSLTKSSSSNSNNNNAVTFGSANLRTFPVSLSMLEQRTGLTAATLGLTDSNVSLDDFKYATLYVTGGSTIAAIMSLAFLPPNIGATLCYGFALLPILFLGIGSTAPGFIAEAIANVRGTNSDTTVLKDGTMVTKLERICRHEAAHFCCGYWCGLPIASYNTIDTNTNVARVEFDVSSPSSLTSGYTPTEVAALTVTAMAGLAAEGAKYGTASGATEDLLTLENTVFRKSKEFIGTNAAQDLTRWGALTASLLLKQNSDRYEKVVNAFQRQAPIEECIAILENIPYTGTTTTTSTTSTTNM